jgi:hypothetical protein
MKITSNLLRATDLDTMGVQFVLQATTPNFAGAKSVAGSSTLLGSCLNAVHSLAERVESELPSCTLLTQRGDLLTQHLHTKFFYRLARDERKRRADLAGARGTTDDAHI